ncbi:sigma 54-interacting transcriptional regulator [Xanthomonas theicola]|uniref:sigma 54-interacting transcriptional regulator n=1 Tax=Xanthomonas theicola TaxID=56464 RepID=UPI001B801B4A|nr:sigma 54-interacting transcriptional regulator [Xanthomonas theicola]
MTSTRAVRLLQERVIEQLGSNRLIPVDFRVIAATKADLGELSADGRFRADLHFRLNVIALDLPPLRTRREGIALLFEHFVGQSALRMNRPPPIGEAAARELLGHA